jgi:hypothetical protein
MTRGVGRSVVSAILMALGVALLFAGLLVVWANDVLFNADRFAGAAVEAVEREEVKPALVRVVVDQIIAQRSDLITVRPLLEAVTDSVIVSPPFRRILTGAALDVHRTLFSTERTLVLDVSDAITVIVGGLRAFDPALAERIPAGLEGGLVRIADQDGATALVDVAEDVRHAAVWLPPLALALLVGAVAVSPRRRSAVTAIGIAVALAAVVGVVGHEVGRRVLVERVEGPEAARAAGAVYDVFSASLVSWLWLAAIAGVLLAAAASATLSVADTRTRLATLRRLATNPPASATGRLALAAAVTLAGVLLILDPGLMLTLIARAAGLLALYLGGLELLRLTGLAGERAGGAGEADRSVRFDPRPLALGVLMAAAVVGAGVLWLNRDSLRGDSIAEAAEVERCNGHAELCDRPLDRVVFAATHNSMSAAREPGWYFASHDGGIPAQLRAGVRGLLIDGHYGFAGSSGVSTDLSDIGTRVQVEATLDPEMIAAAQRLSAGRTRVPAGARREVFLCHGFCELGATPLDTALGGVRDFLRANPHELVILFFEDYVAPAEIEAAFIRSRLIDYVHAHPAGAPWPTLRELIERDERVLVLSENVGDAVKPDWYHDGFALAQETPFSFRAAADFSCRPNRGRPDSPLFQINHWLEKLTPSPGDAAVVNAYDLILARARQCEQERGRLPNLIAVNFYEVGDLLRVVDALNGVGPSKDSAR